jgi:hypothetical protein
MCRRRAGPMCRALDPCLAGDRQGLHRQVRQITPTVVEDGPIGIIPGMCSTDGTPVSPLLQQCATDSTKFFYLTSSSQIVTTFNQIGTNLSNLYIAK